MAALDREWLEDWAEEYRRVCNGLGRLSVIEASTEDRRLARDQHRVRLLESKLALVNEARRVVGV